MLDFLFVCVCVCFPDLESPYETKVYLHKEHTYGVNFSKRTSNRKSKSVALAGHVKVSWTDPGPSRGTCQSKDNQLWGYRFFESNPVRPQQRLLTGKIPMNVRNVGRPLLEAISLLSIRRFIQVRSLINVKCKKAFRWGNQLTQHQKIHTGETL